MTDREKVLRLARDVMGWRIAFSQGQNYAYCEATNEAGDHRYLWSHRGFEWNPLESHNAIAEALAKIPEDKRADVVWHLQPVLLVSISERWALLTATPTQKADAILKALGLWG